MVPSISYHYYAKLFQISCCKIEIAEKIKWLFSSSSVMWLTPHKYIGVRIYEKQQILLCSNRKLMIQKMLVVKKEQISAHFSNSNILVL